MIVGEMLGDAIDFASVRDHVGGRMRKKCGLRGGRGRGRGRCEKGRDG